LQFMDLLEVDLQTLILKTFFFYSCQLIFLPSLSKFQYGEVKRNAGSGVRRLCPDWLVSTWCHFKERARLQAGPQHG